VPAVRLCISLASAICVDLVPACRVAPDLSVRLGCRVVAVSELSTGRLGNSRRSVTRLKLWVPQFSSSPVPCTAATATTLHRISGESGFETLWIPHARAPCPGSDFISHTGGTATSPVSSHHGGGCRRSAPDAVILGTRPGQFLPTAVPGPGCGVRLISRHRQRRRMDTRQIRVSENLYARVEFENREGETLGETLERLVEDYSLTDFADDAVAIDPAFSVTKATDGSVGATPPGQGSRE